MTTIDHQQAAVDRIARVLFCMQHRLSENAYDMARFQGLRDAARREATNALTAAAPHLRAAWAAELGATFQSGERWNETYRKGLRTLQYENAYLDGVIDIIALLEGGAE